MKCRQSQWRSTTSITPNAPYLGYNHLQLEVVIRLSSMSEASVNHSLPFVNAQFIHLLALGVVPPDIEELHSDKQSDVINLKSTQKKGAILCAP